MLQQQSRDGLLNFGGMMRLRGQTNNGMLAKYDVNKLAIDSIASEGRWGATGACRQIGQMEVLDLLCTQN